ncbi:hypothetical protein HOLleu_16000 [Holothuria leucospilota]|uniref:Uncharacterized protein n=1 Tax=Holothuria leucospilota TaxID=206669 RepID=A0A9Q1HA22_HOLLE|nr:hypothetical protein HOLleu_16000 [Holothuria leucospilota]
MPKCGLKFCTPALLLKHQIQCFWQASTHPLPDSPRQVKSYSGKCIVQYHSPPGKYPCEVSSIKEFKGTLHVDK